MTTPSLVMPRDRWLKELSQDVVAAASTRDRGDRHADPTYRYAFDAAMLTTRPPILRRIARALAAMVPPRIDRLAASNVAAAPLTAAVSLELGLPCVFIRAHTDDRVASDGFEGEIYAGEQVVVVAGVLSCEGAEMRTLSHLTAAGAQVVEVVAVVDAEDGAAAVITAAGFVVNTLFTRASLGRGARS